MQLFKCLVNVVKLHTICHEILQRNFALHVLIDELWHAAPKNKVSNTLLWQ